MDLLQLLDSTKHVHRFKEDVPPRDDIEEIFHIENSRKQGKKILIKLDGIDDRTSAESLQQARIHILRADLPELSENTYYWEDLLGFNVFNQNNIKLGLVDSFIETGSNDVLIVKDEMKKNILIPFLINKTIKEVDLENKLIIVDWEN